MLCVVEGCGRERKYERSLKVDGYCAGHYSRVRKTGEPGPAEFAARIPKPVDGLCTVPGCGRESDARAMCHNHYSLWLKNGNPLVRKNLIGVSLRERFEAKLPADLDPEKCWPWQGLLVHGYGALRTGMGSENRLLAHRVSYTFHVGVIPRGLTLDHLCHTRDLACPGGECHHRRCVNPRHLEAVTLAVNIARGRSPAARNARKRTCKLGHELSGENLYLWTSAGGKQQRKCLDCHRTRAREWGAARRAEASATLSEPAIPL